MTACPYHEYYLNQVFSGVGAIYRGSVYQRGHGFGSFLKGLFRSVMLLLRSGLRTVGKEALKTGSYFLTVVANDKPVRESVQDALEGRRPKFKTQGRK